MKQPRMETVMTRTTKKRALAGRLRALIRQVRRQDRRELGRFGQGSYSREFARPWLRALRSRLGAPPPTNRW
jgi:hypothetical protein